MPRVGRAGAHRLDRILEGGAGQRLVVRPRLDAGLMAIGAQLSLEGDLPRHLRPLAPWLEWSRVLYLETGLGKRIDSPGNRKPTDARHVRHDDRDQDRRRLLRHVSGVPAGQLGAEGLYHVGRSAAMAPRTSRPIPSRSRAARPRPARAAPRVDVAAILAAGDAAAGEKVFGKCKACHKIDGGNGTGPHLNGVVGRAGRQRSPASAIPMR